MKRLLSSFILLLVCLMGTGQVPKSFSYQFIVRNKADDIIAESAISCKISILAGSINDTAIYSERHNVRTDKLGSVTLDVGNGTNKTGNFSDIEWGALKYFLKIEIDTTGGTNYKNIGITQILNIAETIPSKNNTKAAQPVTREKLFISRKYAGTFLDYRQTGPDSYNGPNLIWIKTSLEKSFGKISAYGKKCEFSVGDKLYFRRMYYSPGGISGFWVYQIENYSTVNYRMTEYQYDRKVPAESWFK